jgi:hypothetical protein
MSLKVIERGIGVYRVEGLAGVARRLLRRLADRGTPSGEFWSEYLSWLSFAHAGMLSRGNVWSMDYAIRNLPSEAPILEIGSFCGLSTNVITYLKEKYKVKNPLITCDKWIFEGAEGCGMLGDSQSVSHAEYKQFVRETFLRNVQMFSRSDLPFTIELFSDELFGAWATFQKHQDVFGREVRLGGPISFCYIDGNHSYAFARRDFENCDRFLEKGGFILFDDSADGSEWEVCKVVQEVVETRHYDLIAKNPNYFFKKK